MKIQTIFGVTLIIALLLLPVQLFEHGDVPRNETVIMVSDLAGNVAVVDNINV